MGEGIKMLQGLEKMQANGTRGAQHGLFSVSEGRCEGSWLRGGRSLVERRVQVQRGRSFSGGEQNESQWPAAEARPTGN